MALEVGSIVEGQVTGIARFGAFVELPKKRQAWSTYLKSQMNL